MAKRRRLKEKKKPLINPQVAALFGVGIMIISSLAYAVLYKPPGSETQSGAEAIEAQPFETFPEPLAEQPLISDSDGDGITDELEAEIGTDPLVRDTPASLEERRSQIYQDYVAGKLSLEAYTELSKKLEEAKKLLR
jgi:hypothetical protein